MTQADFSDDLCTYGEGYTGSTRLRTAMARHLNAHFQPVNAIDPEQITFAAGVTDLNEVCAMVTADPGDYIMLGRPIYGPFSKDLVLRTG
jgi:1-aminocyclopropane-1-carboxylate synthase